MVHVSMVCFLSLEYFGIGTFAISTRVRGAGTRRCQTDQSAGAYEISLLAWHYSLGLLFFLHSYVT